MILLNRPGCQSQFCPPDTEGKAPTHCLYCCDTTISVVMLDGKEVRDRVTGEHLYTCATCNEEFWDGDSQGYDPRWDGYKYSEQYGAWE